MKKPERVIWILALILLSVCTCARIGLPEDHVDTDSCFDRACISERDWSEIGEKWHNFKETVHVMDGTNGTDIRQRIWRTFQNGLFGENDGKVVNKDLKEIQFMKNVLDRETESARATYVEDTTTRYDHQAIIAMEGDLTVQKAAHYLYNKHPSVSTLYEYSPETDTLKVIAGEEHLITDRSRIQIVGHGKDTLNGISLSEKSPTELAEIIRKLPIKSSEVARVSLVGCNIGKGGQSEFLNDGFTEQFLKSLWLEQNVRTEVSSRNGLVSVTSSGKKETGEITTDGIQWFSKDSLTKNVFRLGEYGEVSREILPLTERIPTYNQISSGALVKLNDIDRTKSIDDNIKPIYIEKTNKNTNQIEQMKQLNVNDIGEFIKTLTKSNFLSEIDFVKQNIIDRPSNTQKIINEIYKTVPSFDKPGTELVVEKLEKIQVQQITDSRRISHSQFKGSMHLFDPKTGKEISKRCDFTIELTSERNIKISLRHGTEFRLGPIHLDSGIKANWKYVARLTKTFDRVINVENVRTINNKADMIYEINFLGTFGGDFRAEGRFHQLYRFGDVVYRMSRNNFYISWEGMIASDSTIIWRHFSDQQVKETEINDLKDWMWVDKFNRMILPKHGELERYPDLRKRLEEVYIDEVIDKQIGDWAERGYTVSELDRETTWNLDKVSFTLKDRGWRQSYRSVTYDNGNVPELMGHFSNGDHARIQTNFRHVLEGTTVLAICLSEPIRNFRAFTMNEMLIHMNEISPISIGRLIQTHPMTRGRSWGNLKFTGLTVNEYGYFEEQARIVLPRELNIARTFLLDRTGQDENNRYKYLTESEYTAKERSLRPGELSTITKPITGEEIRNTIAEFKPGNTDVTIREPLGVLEYPTVQDIEVFSDVSQGKAMPIRASVSMINDYITMTNHISKVIAEKTKSTGRNFEVIESSIVISGENVEFILQDKADPNVKEKVNVKIDDDLLASNKIKEETNAKMKEIENPSYTPSKSLIKLNEFLGVYGIVMGFRGAIQDFEEGKIFEGIMNVAQSVHGVYGMSQTAQRVVQKISSNFLSRGIQEAETGLTAATTEMSTALSRGTTAAEEAVTVAGEAAEDIPILGTIFGVYNTIQDLRRGTAIGYVDAALDAAIVISTLFGPEALVVTVALTVVRLVIDDFYYAISNELNSLPPNATVLQKIGAVFKGVLEGIVMVVKNIVDFLSLGFFSLAETSNKIDTQYRKDHELLHKLADYHNYFKVEKEEGSSQELINFASGHESWNGGSIIFNMFDDDTARLRMLIVDDNGNEKTLDKYITLDDNANDIVLGIGESHDISFKKHSAKLFWFIPVHSRYLINKVTGEKSSLHGTYYGNSKNNKFFTIQKLPKDAKLGYSLSDYFYEIDGGDGDDIFYLGPQKSVVKGGNGKDMYIIPYSGGRTEINNYAEDLLEDVLYMQVDFEAIHVDRHGNDLYLQHGYDHDVIVKNWYSGHRMGHLTFKANNGVIFNVTLGIHGQAEAVPLAVVLSGEDEGHTIDVSKGVWKNVVLVKGTDASDVIIGNEKNNMLDGGKGANTLQGGAGSDTYLIHSLDVSESSNWNEINNYDPKMTVDKIIFDVPLKSIIATHDGQNIQLYTSLRNGPKVLLLNWFSSEHYRHLLCVTTDDVIFQLTHDINDHILIHPIIIDASNEKSRVVLDASQSVFINVSTIIGSNYDDYIKGNTGNNYIKGGQGIDKVSGGEGRDVYVVGKEDIGDYINNFAEDKKEDLVLADFDYKDISVSTWKQDVVVSARGNRIFTISDWIRGVNWRHISVRTIDGYSFKLDIDSSNRVKKIPIEIDKSGEKGRQTIRTFSKSMDTVELIIGSNSTDVLTGNKHSNRIDPGFGGAYMMALEGHDQYVINEHYNGPNIVNNFANDNLTDTIKLPALFADITTNVSNNDVIVTSNTNPSSTVVLENYIVDPYRRHLVINTVKDGVMFTIPPSRNFEPVPISIDRSDRAHNLIVDLNSNWSWNDVVTVVGAKEHNNVIRGNTQNNTITGGILSDTLEGGTGNDVIRGNQGDDFLDGGAGDDILVGGDGEDWIDGGMGDDVIYPGPDGDHVKGGPGFDVIIVFGDAQYTTGVYIDLLNGHGFGGDAQGDIYVSVEGVIGGFYGDLLVGDHSDNYLDGKEGNDILFPLRGNDVLVGGEGSDIYDIGEVLGEKLIRNLAQDEAMDFVNLKLYERDLVYLERRSEDLVLHVGVPLDGSFCSKLNYGPYHFEQWFTSSKHQHITVQLAGEDVVLNDFKTGSLMVHSERPDTEARQKQCDQLLKDLMEYDIDYYAL